MEISKMKIFFFFIFLSFVFDTKASNSINGKEIEDLVNAWLKKIIKLVMLKY